MATTISRQTVQRKNPLLPWLLGWYVCWWAWLAVSPLDRSDWLLENVLVIVFAGTLALTYRRYPLSDLSYLLLTIFMTLHAVGAHYTYAKVPLGFWLQEWFNQDRNHFDRLIHFSFGLLLTYPLREIYLRWIGRRDFWSYFFPVSVSLSLSSFFELVEAWVARIVSPELGAAYLGTQGDSWDAHKDINIALVGAILAMILTALLQPDKRWSQNHEPGKTA